MKKLDENYTGTSYRGDFTRGLPFYGVQGDFNFALGRSKFTPGISIKQVPMTDMSVDGDVGFSDFDLSVGTFRHFFKPGDRIRGTLVNSHLKEDGTSRTVVGKILKIKPDYSNNTIRVWLKDPRTLEVKEVYADTIERIYESRSNMALTFAQFIAS